MLCVSWSAYEPPKEAVRLVESAIAKRAKELDLLPNHRNQYPHLIVFLSRDETSNNRVIDNENEVFRVLQSNLGPDRVQLHRGDGVFQDDVSLFMRTRVIVGAHGAGCRYEI